MLSLLLLFYVFAPKTMKNNICEANSHPKMMVITETDPYVQMFMDQTFGCLDIGYAVNEVEHTQKCFISYSLI